MKALIAAFDLEGNIGNADTNSMLWGVKDLPSDMARFKTLTTGNTVVMGSKTWDSLNPKYKPLPNRTNIVLSRDDNFFMQLSPDVAAPHFWDFELENIEHGGKKDIFVIGGGALYRYALETQYVDTLFLTVIHHVFDVPNPVKFPFEFVFDDDGIVDTDRWGVVVKHTAQDGNYLTTFYHLRRKK